MNALRINKIRGKQVQIRVNGKVADAYLGESLHAALIAEQKRVLRSSAIKQEGRGVFCGMGVCYECQVTINGVANVRACMTEVSADMDIITNEY